MKHGHFGEIQTVAANWYTPGLPHEAHKLNLKETNRAQCLHVGANMSDKVLLAHLIYYFPFFIFYYFLYFVVLKHKGEILVEVALLLFGQEMESTLCES